MTGRQAVMLRCHVALLALAIPDLSRRLPLPRLLALFTPRGPSRLYSGMREDEIADIVRRVLRRPWRMRGRRCLRLGLLLFHFLRLAGLPAELNFGVYKRHVTGREQAHCWVTVAGRCVSSPPADEHVVILVHVPTGPRADRIAA